MASKNVLLGSGKVVVEKAPPEPEVSLFPRWIYHKELAPVICKTEEEFKGLKAKGYDFHDVVFPPAGSKIDLSEDDD